MDYLSSLCLSVFIKKNTFYWNRFSKPKRRVIEIQVKTSFFLGGVDAGASQKRGEMDHPQRERPAAGDQAQQRHECDERIWNHMILTNKGRFSTIFTALKIVFWPESGMIGLWVILRYIKKLKIRKNDSHVSISS